MHPESGFRIAPNWPKIRKMTMTSKFVVFKFLSILLLVLELWQLLFISNLPEIRKSEIPPPEFCPISVDWGELGIPNLARMFLMKGYSMLQNAANRGSKYLPSPVHPDYS